ncbi:MAG: hypothetical protein H6745_04995 [Deltaproteobacteria bacterium]|nr:hypothetical protein [Deltaproteobacteria bacterium]
MNLDATLAGGRRRASLPLAAALAFVALAPASCADGGSPTAAPAGSSLRVEVAPLSLPDVGDARYTLTVANSSGTVWSRTITSSAYGDGAGALSYVGPCEAGLPHTVTLDLEALFDTSGAEIPASSWHDPTPISRPAPCAPNADTPVTFDLTIARAASQGFFDVAIQLDDIFCSAKLDCVTGSPGDYHDLELLHRPDGGPRDLTAILGLACISATGGPTSLYLDDLTISCDNLPDPILVDPSGLGLVDLDTAPSQNLDAYLFAASISRGGDGASSAAFWNVALGLDETTFTTAGPCRLTTLATASRTPFPTDSEGSLLPPDTAWPVIAWDVPLSDTARACTVDPLDAPASHVTTSYRGYLSPAPNQLAWDTSPLHLRCRLDAASDTVSCGTRPTPEPPPDPEPPAAPDPVTFSNTATGKAGSLQSWTVPATGSYRLEAWGAQGGNPRGGKGAYVAGDFDLTQGQVLSIGVGQMGSTADTTGTTTADGGGGGGASWVYIKSPITLFLVAGGGGGGGHGGRSGGPGLTGTSGGGALGTGGTNGGGGQNGGGNAYAGAGGAGWNGAGHAAYWSTATTIAGSGGNTIRSSATGGTGTTNNGTVTHGDGGYGGGGAAVHTSGATRGGGGGGYSGGDGAPNATGGMAGGGGGSFNAGTNTTAQSGARTGHGQVVISPNW